jgi:hypothetical protein
MKSERVIFNSRKRLLKYAAILGLRTLVSVLILLLPFPRGPVSFFKMAGHVNKVA